MSYFSQMVALAVHNFTSAAVGICVALALIRGITRRRSDSVGNFWVDMTRGILYVLLPISFVLALVLVWQGVPQTLDGYGDATGLEGIAQTLAWGPIASQEAIKELGTNGGGFLNANSAHPYENPTAITNFLEMLAILAIPAGLTYTFGRWAGDTRQGWALFAAMSVIFLGFVAVCYWAETQENPALKGPGHRPVSRQPRGQGDALRRAALGALGSRHDGHVMRRRELDARQLQRDSAA